MPSKKKKPGQKPQYQKEKQAKRDKKQEKDKAEKPAPVEVPEEIDPVHEEKKLALAKKLQRESEQEKLDEEKGGSGSQSSDEEGPEVVALEPDMPEEEHLNEAEWRLRMQEAKELIQAESEDDSKKALEILTKVNKVPHDREHEGYRLVAMSKAHAHLSDVEGAVKCFTETFKILKEAADQDVEHRILENLGEVEAKPPSELEVALIAAMEAMRSSQLLGEDEQVSTKGVEGVMAGMMRWMLDYMKQGKDADGKPLGSTPKKRKLHATEVKALTIVDNLLKEEKVQEKDQSGLHQLMKGGQYWPLACVINRLLRDKDDEDAAETVHAIVQAQKTAKVREPTPQELSDALESLGMSPDATSQDATGRLLDTVDFGAAAAVSGAAGEIAAKLQAMDRGEVLEEGLTAPDGTIIRNREDMIKAGIISADRHGTEPREPRIDIAKTRDSLKKGGEWSKDESRKALVKEVADLRRAGILDEKMATTALEVVVDKCRPKCATVVADHARLMKAVQKVHKNGRRETCLSQQLLQLINVRRNLPRPRAFAGLSAECVCVVVVARRKRATNWGSGPAVRRHPPSKRCLR